MQRGFRDDGPKLREEKQLEDFYSDLDKDTLIPILTPEQGSRFKTLGLENGGNEGAGEHTGHLKQLIFNGKATLEPIKLHHKRSRFKKCKHSISQLGGRVSNQGGKKSMTLKSRVSMIDFKENETPYFSKFFTPVQSQDEILQLPTNLEQISRNLAGLKVEYDMDEQDDLYLQFLNDTCCKQKMNEEVFELLISALEKEWTYLEKLIPPKSLLTEESLSGHRSETTRLHYELFGSDDGTERTTDQTCAVCGGGDSDNANAIVFCDGCDIAVHQECYGIVFIPEGQWLCRRCLVSKNRKVSCLFCPSHTGAFKQTDTGSWAHVICGLWIPELYYANLHYMEPIEGVENISRSRWKLLCSICKQRMGACIQCTNKSCFTAFHVTCAKRAGLYMDFGGASISEVAANQVGGLNMLSCFCGKHSPANWPDTTKGVLKTRRYFAEYNESEIATNLQRNQHGRDNRFGSLKDKWKTNRGTPIAPNVFAEHLSKIIDYYGIPNGEMTAFNICKYWSMKRELKRGGQLVRKHDPSSSNVLDEVQLQERINVTDILLEDLKKLRDLTSLVQQRTSAQNRLRRVSCQVNCLSRNPKGHFMKTFVIDKFLESEAFKNLEKSLKESASVSRLDECKFFDTQDYESWNVYPSKVTSIINGIEEDPSSTRGVRNLARKAESLFKQLLKEFDAADIARRFHEDFFVEDGKIAVRPWKGQIIKDQEELSDVEELNTQEFRLLRKLL